MFLSDLKEGERGIITRVRGRGAFRKRIVEMGFIAGRKVTMIKRAPLGDPVEYNIMGYQVSLRKSESAMIEIVQATEFVKEPQAAGFMSSEAELKETVKREEKTIYAALVGNPNSGKTSLFNLLSHSREKVGNYSGVTVESKVAQLNYKGYRIILTDLPGTYSLTAYTPEEVFVREHVANNLPDMVINVIDGSNLERNLYLTTQLIDMDVRMVIALNMYDELNRSGDKLDHQLLGKMLGVPIVPTVARKSEGLSELLDKVINVHAGKDKTFRHIHIRYGDEIEKSIASVQKLLKRPEHYELTDIYSSRFLAIKAIEKDRRITRLLSQGQAGQDIADTVSAEIRRLEKLYADDSESLITDARYGVIAGALKETYSKNLSPHRQPSERIDRFLTHRWLGIPLFFVFLWLIFQGTFTIGRYPMDGIQEGVSLLGNFIRLHMAEGPLKDMLIQGVIAGVGGVIIFLPNILILFFFISFMEDTGYMARAAFIMDKLMHKIGLHGRSFIPMIMGFGCNVPAILSTRTIENRNDRILTMLINPFMSCSARLPVYILFIGAFFPKHPGTVLFLIYATGIFTAVVLAIVFKKTLFRAKGIPFVMELPPYRMPTARATVLHMWNRTSQYLRKMGGIILVASILIWALGYYPKPKTYSKNYAAMAQTIQNKYNSLANHFEASGLHDSATFVNEEVNEALHQIDAQKKSEEQGYSMIGRIGKWIQPVMSPLGFDWRMSVSILSGVAAKEIVVSTLAVLYHGDPHSESKDALAARLKEQVFTSGPYAGEPVFTALNALSFMVFVLLYFPCIASITAIKNESGHWKWALFTVGYTSVVAWLMAFTFYQLGSLIIHI